MKNMESEPKPLSEAEAQEEAGMMRAKLEISPETGKNEEGREPTAEDYDAALKAIEELKELAESEPATKVMDVLARLAVHSKYAAQMVLASFAEMGLFIMPAIEKRHEEAIKRLETASMKIARLKQEAEKYDRSQS